MDVLIERACGLDVHKKSITACIVTPEGKEIKTFRTHTVYFSSSSIGLEAPLHPVAMESTGVFWKPIVNLLEAEDIEFLVVNAQHMKAVPDQKTDVKDSEWICDLLRQGDMLEAMANDETDPESLAGFARRTMKKKKEELELAIRGNMSSHQRMMLRTMLTHIDFLSEQIAELDLEVANRLAPFSFQVTTKAPANASPPKPAKATRISVLPSP